MEMFCYTAKARQDGQPADSLFVVRRMALDPHSCAFYRGVAWECTVTSEGIQHPATGSQVHRFDDPELESTLEKLSQVAVAENGAEPKMMEGPKSIYQRVTCDICRVIRWS